jgi:hypothetical protein
MRARTVAPLLGAALVALCAWPMQPRYTGGNIEEAASFSCR